MGTAPAGVPVLHRHGAATGLRASSYVYFRQKSGGKTPPCGEARPGAVAPVGDGGSPTGLRWSRRT